MKKDTYISIEEREKCRKVADAFTEVYEKEDIVVLDAGKYGYVKLQYYKEPFGFDDVFTYTDSRELFDDLWDEWFNGRLLEFASDTPMMEFDYPDIFKCLPKDKQKELMDKKIAFAEEAGIIL